ncbi:MAG: hypothetical protein ACT4PQ_08175 [Betaproteobacteria bacterium]
MNRVRVLLMSAAACLLLAGCEREKDRLDAEVRQLCAKDGGIKLHETVTLSPEEYRKLLNRDGELDIRDKDHAKATDAFYFEPRTGIVRKGDPVLVRWEYRLIRQSDMKLLATNVYYTRRGGDLPGPWRESSFSCPDAQSKQKMAGLAIKQVGP